MAKIKYRFNAESLSYDRVEGSFKQILFRALPFVLSVLFVGVTLFLLAMNNVIDTPEEKKLKRELTNMLTQYDVINSELDRAKEVLDNIQFRDDNIYRTIFEAEPIPSEVRKAGFGGVNRYAHLQGYDNSVVVVETTKKLDVLLTQLYIQSKSYDEVTELAKSKERYLACIPGIQPIKNRDLTHIASHFGWRNDPVYRTKKFHEGIDFTASTGTDVFVTGDGVVKEVVFSRRGYGNQVVVDHGFGFKTRYAHLHKIKVVEGQQLKRGELIGEVGSTGKSVGPHLHYEVLKSNQAINPINYFYLDLTPSEYDSMIEASSYEGGQTLD